MVGKITFCLSLMLSLSILSFGQTSLVPLSVSVDNFTADSADVVGYTTITNESALFVQYTWTRNVIEISEGWETAVCDIVQCYFPTTNSQSFGLPAGATGNIDVHVYPDGTDGGALIEVTVQDENNINNVVTGTYLFTSGLLSTSPELINNALKIFPNPAVSQFSIEESDKVQRIQIFDITGKLVKEVRGFGINLISIDEIEKGNYIVRMWDESNTQISTNILSVQ